MSSSRYLLYGISALFNRITVLEVIVGNVPSIPGVSHFKKTNLSSASAASLVNEYAVKLSPWCVGRVVTINEVSQL